MNQAEYKVRNLESQILYLQQEHSNTLKLLHNEIKDLQMKNSEMSFQLAMINVNSQDGDIEKSQTDNAHLIEQISQLKLEVSSLNTQLSMKITQLEEYDKKIHQLTETVKKIKESHNVQLASMEIELAHKSSDIAILSTKLFNTKRLSQTKSIVSSPIDTEPSPPSLSPFVVQHPIAPKTFKFRNQITVHPDNTHLRRRPIIARQTLISTSVPIKNMITQPEFPEYAVSVEDRAVFSKSIKRPNILPPINSTKHHNLSDIRRISSITMQDSSTDPVHSQYFDLTSAQKLSDANIVHVNTNFSQSSSDPNFINVDHLMDINNSSLISSSSSSQPVKCTVSKNFKS